MAASWTKRLKVNKDSSKRLQVFVMKIKLEEIRLFLTVEAFQDVLDIIET